ncbi:MAG: XdhC family protein, partial [Halanaerobiales bacterium]|nr:XdhC family protein [Halanaerobiales bacterium]
MKKEILKKIIELKKENLKLARAFIIQAKSSSPRNTGTEMIISEEGETFGSIGGGQDEKKVIEKAMALIEKGKSEKLKLTLTRKEAAEIGWVCGGQIDIFI